MQYESMRHAQRTACTLGVGVLLTITGWAAESNLSRDLLVDTKRAQESIRNYRCSAEYMDYEDYAARRRQLDEAVKMEDAPPGLIAYCEENLEGSGKKYESQNVVADNTGKMKSVHIYGKYGPNGEKQPVKQMSCAWDGTTSVDYSRALNATEPGGAVITATQPVHFRVARNPLWSFGGRFLAALEESIRNGESIDIRRTADGSWQIRFAGQDPVHGGPRWTWSGMVDPSRGFSVPQWGFTADDGTRCHFSATFTEVADGIWFPTEGRIESLFSDDTRESFTSVKMTDVVVNDPNFSANLFHIDLPKGTHVQDTVMGIAFFVGDPGSTRVLGDATTTAHIITKGVGPNDPAAEETFFLPHVKQALEKSTPFVLNLRTRKLVGVDAADGSQEVLNSLYGAGAGDLFWDGGIVVAGDTKIELVLGERTKPLPRRKMEHGTRYRLPERVELPCVLRVTDKAKSRYHIVVKEISEKGISIRYKLLPDR